MTEKQHEEGHELQLLMKDECGSGGESGGESTDELVSGDRKKRAVEVRNCMGVSSHWKEPQRLPTTYNIII